MLHRTSCRGFPQSLQFRCFHPLKWHIPNLHMGKSPFFLRIPCNNPDTICAAPPRRRRRRLTSARRGSLQEVSAQQTPVPSIFSFSKLLSRRVTAALLQYAGEPYCGFSGIFACNYSAVIQMTGRTPASCRVTSRPFTLTPPRLVVKVTWSFR